MSDEKNLSTLKWGLGAAGIGAALWFTLPYLLAVVWGAFELALGGLGLLALWYVYPSLVELIANLSYLAYIKSIRSSPTAKLWRELKAFKEVIDEEDKQIVELSAQISSADSLMRQEATAGNLTQDQVDQMQSSIEELVAGVSLLQSQRDMDYQDYKEFEVRIKQEEAAYRIGNALSGAAKALNKAQNSGLNSEGVKISIDEISQRSARARAEMASAIFKRSTDQRMRAEGKERAKAVVVKPTPRLGVVTSEKFQPTKVVEPAAVKLPPPL